MTDSPKNKRRQRRGAAWYWKQTDSWYFTPKGTKRRQALLDGDGKRVRGADNKREAQLAMARVRLKHGLELVDEVAKETPDASPWMVARVCSAYLRHCEQAVAAGRMHAEHRLSVLRYLNQLYRYCGAMNVSELKRGHIAAWVDSQPTWRSPVTRRNVITIILAAFNHAENEHGIRNPLRGLKKPPSRPRLHSFSAEDEQVLYAATDEAFGNFLLAAIHTGLRPFCELTKITADHVEQMPRGMLWRVYSSKTKKVRKIPVRPEVATLVRKLMKTAPKGSGVPLFRNSQNRPWTRPAGRARFYELKKRLGWDQDAQRRVFTTYTARHTFAHRMLSGFWNNGAGCSIEVLAELMGNSPTVAYAHYGREWAQRYQDPLWAALGG